jgi:hypothetical protein
MSNLPDLNLKNLLGFIDFAEASERKETGVRGWMQSSWGWVNRAFEMGNREAARQAATDMRNGVCRSAFCAAGHAAYESGHRLIFNAGTGYNYEENGERSLGLVANFCIAERPVRNKATGNLVTDAKGRVLWEDVPRAPLVSIPDAGAEWYGLDRDEADAFFLPENDLDTMKALINGFCSAREMDLPYPDLGALDPFGHLVDHGERYEEADR